MASDALPAPALPAPALPDHAGQAAAARWPILRWQGGQAQPQDDWLVDESPVTLHWLCAQTGTPLAQVSALVTPVQLEDFATGHSLLEGWLDEAGAIERLDVLPLHGRIAVTLAVAPDALRRLGPRLTGAAPMAAAPAARTSSHVDSACGLCGEADARPWLTLPSPLWAWDSQPALSLPVLARALSCLSAKQPLQALTGSAHAAAWLDERTGELVLAREDVGRHHALDKLAGALACWRAGHTPVMVAPAGGTVLMSSRASAELVRKAVRLGATRLVCLGGATHLAAQWARQAGLGLAAFARPGQLAVIAGPERFEA